VLHDNVLYKFNIDTDTDIDTWINSKPGLTRTNSKPDLTWINSKLDLT